MNFLRPLQLIFTRVALPGAFVLALAHPACADWTVEADLITTIYRADSKGHIVPRVTQETIYIKVKGDMARFDKKEYSTVVNMANDDRVLIIHTTKRISKRTGEEVRKSRTAAPAPVKPVLTDRKAVIDGHETTQYDASFPGQSVVCWVSTDAKDLPNQKEEVLRACTALFARTEGSVDFQSLPACPIKISVAADLQKQKLPDGKTIDVPGPVTVRTIKSIKKEDLDPKLFTDFEGYKESKKD